MIINAPVLFFLAVLLVTVVLYFMMRAFFGERMETLRERSAFLGKQLHEYKAKLSGATPEQAAEEIEKLRSRLGQYASPNGDDH